MWTLLLTLGIILYSIRFILNKIYGTIDPQNEVSVKGKTVVITGANAGIGRWTAYEFAKRDATVILACRDLGRANDAIKFIRDRTPNGQLVSMHLDLTSLEGVRKFVGELEKKGYDKIDILVNNAAVMLNAEKGLKTQDGFEIHFGVNYLGHFLLTKLLLEKLKKAKDSRVVNVSAIAYPHGNVQRLLGQKPNASPVKYEYSFLDKLFMKQIGPGNKPYSDSKMANAMFSQELARRLKGTGVRTYALCPGVVSTGIADTLELPKPVMILLKYFLKCVLKTPEQGSWTTLHCALSKDLINESGQMYQHCGFWAEKDRLALSDEDCVKLWNLSEKLVGIIPQ